MQTVLVTITGPAKSRDLDVPGEIAVRDLLPELVKLCGTSSAAEITGESSAWVLRFPEGNLLDTSRSLIELGVMDGAVLVLQNRYLLERERARAPQFQPQPVAPSRETGGIGIFWNKDGFREEN